MKYESVIDSVIVNEEGREEVERMEIVDGIKVKERIKAAISERADWAEAANTNFK